MFTHLKRISLLLVAILILIPSGMTLADEGDSEWEGIVDSRPSPGLIGTWVIGGLSFEANASTEFEQEHGALDVGVCAKVEYYIAGGANIAAKIESQEAYKCDNGGGSPGEHLKLYAHLESFPPDLIGAWVVGGMTFTADANTRFEYKAGPFVVGGCVEVEYNQGSDLALELETEAEYKCSGGGGPYGQVYGVLDAFPPGLVGAWTVSGVDYTADANTRFEQEHGPFFVGGCVDVKYEVGTTNAAEISTTEAYKCSNNGGGGGEPVESKFYGLIDDIPPGNVGTWTIGNGPFISTATTELEQEHGAFAVGVCAEVEYYQDANGDHIATKIGTEELYKCNNSTYTNEVYGTIESFPPDLYGSWLIMHSGTYTDTYNAGATTQFEQEHGAFADGGCVKIEYYVENGVNQAAKIESKEGSHCSDTPSLPGDSKVYATIDSFPPSPYIGDWTIGGVAYQATADSRFEQEHGDFAVGVCVKAKYTASGGVNTLSQVETEQAYKCQSQGGGSPEFKSYGVVEIFPAGLIGAWQVSGVTYEADAGTQFKQEHGFFAVGAYVEVKYTTDGSTHTALSIETHVAPGAGLDTVVGSLDAYTGNDAWADWTVEGVTYKADPVIKVGKDSQAPVVGQLVFLNTYRRNGTTYVTLAARAYRTFLPLLQR